MPDGTGFDVIRKIGSQHMPAVVFVAAYDKYAIQAFKVDQSFRSDADQFGDVLSFGRSHRRISDEESFWGCEDERDPSVLGRRSAASAP
jgi:two-component system LytT family response regulator